MTKDKDFKQLAHARAARTGESYTTARRNLAAKSEERAPAVARYWFTRASKGYGGRGAKPTGLETAILRVGRRGIEVEISAAFSNYGLHRYTASAKSEAPSSRFVYGDQAITIESSLDGSSWVGIGTEGNETRPFAITLAEPFAPTPSVIARFLPLRLPRVKGDLLEYLPVPEDGFPGWKPTTLKSWFPLMGASRESLVTPRVITCQGLAELKIGRKAVEAYRYDHVDRNGKVHATTWIGEDDAVIQYEQTGLLLKAVSEEEAPKLDPGKEE